MSNQSSQLVTSDNDIIGSSRTETNCYVGCTLVTAVLLLNPFGFTAGILMKHSRFWTRAMLILAILWGITQAVLCIVAALLIEQSAESSDGSGYVLFVPAFFSSIFCRYWTWLYKKTV